MDQRPVTILDVEFQCNYPYSAGSTIDEAEAATLNAVRAKAVASTLRPEIKKFVDGAAGAKTKNELDDLFAAADSRFVFSLPLSPIDREARKLARELVRDSLAEEGQKIGDIPEGMTEDEWEAQIDTFVDNAIAQYPQITETAKEIVAQRADKVKVSLKDLGLGQTAAQ